MYTDRNRHRVWPDKYGIINRRRMIIVIQREHRTFMDSYIDNRFSFSCATIYTIRIFFCLCERCNGITHESNIIRLIKARSVLSLSLMVWHGDNEPPDSHESRALAAHREQTSAKQSWKNGRASLYTHIETGNITAWARWSFLYIEMYACACPRGPLPYKVNAL